MLRNQIRNNYKQPLHKRRLNSFSACDASDPCPEEDWITNSHSCTIHVLPYLVRLTTTKEAGGSDSRDNSSWKEEANRERVETEPSTHLNVSDSGSSVSVVLLSLSPIVKKSGKRRGTRSRRCCVLVFRLPYVCKYIEPNILVLIF